MCGRYNIIDDPLSQALLEILGIELQLTTRYNIAPTEQVPVICDIQGQRQCHDMRWWLTPSWSDGPSTRYAMFNARAESVAKSPAFRGPLRRQRAILPASSFIEWQKQGDAKQAYELQLEDRAIAFAGLWDLWQNDTQQLYSCSIITTDAVAGFSHIHQRMPLMLDHTDFETWLNPSTAPETIAALLTPNLPTGLLATPVDSSINNARKKIAPTPAGGTEEVAQ